MRITYPALFIVMLWLGCLNIRSQTQGTAPQVSQAVVETRLAAMNQLTPIRLDYNKQVQAYIDVYTVRRREHMANIIGRSQLYFPMFDEYLDKYGLPHELKNLAIIESALDPRAKSSSGAMGLWQFLYHAASMFDLSVTNYTDERCDAIKSTDAACRYLQYLYRNFNDWHLALAAYNTGIVEVKKAIERAGGKKSFWDIQPYLPEAARSYVPAFIGATYAMANYNLYGITPQTPKYTFTDVDTVWVNKSLTFEQISRAIDLSMDDLSLLNPIYTKNYIPFTGQPAALLIPIQKIPLFIKEEKKLPSTDMPTAQSMLPVMQYIKTKVVHTVERGEYFHKIAMRYHCTVEEIMTWNHLNSRSVQAGQSLIIWTQKPVPRFFFVDEEYPVS